MKISESQKIQVLQHMQYVVNDKKGKLIALSFSTFLENKDKNTDADFYYMINEIQDIIIHNEIFALNQLGFSFFFFKNFRFYQHSFEELISEMQQFGRFIKKVSVHKNYSAGGPVNNTTATAERAEPVISNSQSKRNQHIEEVGACYESFKDLLRDLFADMQPAAFSGPVNNRISEVYKKLSDLRNLACKNLPA